MKRYDGAELFRRCGITDILVDERDEAVARKESFTFRLSGRGRYVVVKGLMPLAAALDLYRHPAARQDVRAGGHAASVSPDLEAVWMTADGEEIIVDPDGKKVREWEAYAVADADTTASRFAFAADPTKLGARQYVTLYHVDSELGLHLLVEKIGSLVPSDTERLLLELESRAAAYQGMLSTITEEWLSCDEVAEVGGMMRTLVRFFDELRSGGASMLLRRHDLAVQEALREISEDLYAHKRAIDRELDKRAEHSDVDPLVTFRKLVVALAALRDVR